MLFNLLSLNCVSAKKNIIVNVNVNKQTTPSSHIGTHGLATIKKKAVGFLFENLKYIIL